MMMRVKTQRGYVMPGLGTIINTAAIVAGGLLGLLFKNLLTKSMEDTLLKASSVCVLFIGIGGAMSQMLKITDGALITSGSMMLIICFVLGGLVGELLNIEGAFERFGAWLRKKTHNESDSGFLSGFIHASLTVCIGAMAIVGSIQDGLLGDASLLCAKAALDAVIILVMTASMGKGCIFSAIPVAIFTGRCDASFARDRARDDRRGNCQPVFYGLCHDLLRGREPHLGQNDQGREPASDARFCRCLHVPFLNTKYPGDCGTSCNRPGFRLFFRSLAGLDARDVVRHGLVDKVVEPVAVEQVRARAPCDKRRFLRVIAREISAPARESAHWPPRRADTPV